MNKLKAKYEALVAEATESIIATLTDTPERKFSFVKETELLENAKSKDFMLDNYHISSDGYLDLIGNDSEGDPEHIVSVYLDESEVAKIGLYNHHDKNIYTDYALDYLGRYSVIELSDLLSGCVEYNKNQST